MYFVGDADDVPDFVATRDRFVGYLVSFVRTLREMGVQIPANASTEATRALVEVGFDDKERARSALCAVLISRPDDLSLFHQLFPSFWNQLIEDREPAENFAPEQNGDTFSSEFGQNFGAPSGASNGVSDGDDTSGETGTFQSLETTVDIGDSPGGEVADEATETDAATASVYSPTGRSEPIEVAPVTRRRMHDDALTQPLRRLTAAIARLRGRRWTRPGDERVDTRRALRESFATGGTVISVPERRRTYSAVQATLLVDVSQSVLDAIDRGFLIQFIYRAVDAWRDVQVFFFDTSVRDVTDAFDAPTSETALAALDRAEEQWGGGTRIGNALTTIRREKSTAIGRNSVVFLISDGLEVGEIDVLEDGMSWMSRRAGAVLWLNPLAVSPEYEPSCRGMKAALPYVDGLFAFAGPDDIEEIARQLEQQGLHGRIGYAFDPRRTTDPTEE